VILSISSFVIFHFFEGDSIKAETQVTVDLLIKVLYNNTIL
jgi:hypothetical protein